MPQKDNKILQKLFREDQQDRKRKLYEKDVEAFLRCERERQQKVYQIIKDKKINTPRDYFCAAMILHHASGVTNKRKAVQFAKKSVEMGNDDARWLFAAATDRLLVHQGKKQRFGTQFTSKDGKSWKLYPVDQRISDKTRAQYNVPPISETYKRSSRWRDLPKEG